MYIVTGGGGRDLSGVPGPQGEESFQESAFSEHHLTTFSVEDHQIVIRAIDHTGAQRDTATIVKRRLFQRADDHPLDLLGGRVRIGHHDEDLRLLLLGEERERQPDQRDGTEDDQTEEEHAHGDGPTDGGFRKGHGARVPGC